MHRLLMNEGRWEKVPFGVSKMRDLSSIDEEKTVSSSKCKEWYTKKNDGH